MFESSGPPENLRPYGYCDDFNVAIRDAPSGLADVATCVREFELAAGLKLKTAKCVIVRLGADSNEDVLEHVSAVAPGLVGNVTADSALLLGAVVGPGSGDLSWERILPKFEQRVKLVHS